MIREHNIVMLKITNILSTAMQLLISDHGFGLFLKSMHLPFAAIVILQNTCSWNKEEFRKNWRLVNAYWQHVFCRYSGNTDEVKWK